MTSVPLLPIWRIHCRMEHCKAATCLTRKFLTNYPLPMNGKILAGPIFHALSILRMSHVSTTYHNRCIIWVKLISMECAKLTSWSHSEMQQRMSEFPALDTYSVHILKRTGDVKLVYWCSDMIRMYLKSIYSFNFRMGNHTTVNHVTAQQLMRIYDLIVRSDEPIPTRESCVNQVLATVPNSPLGSGSGSTRNRAIAMGPTT